MNDPLAQDRAERTQGYRDGVIAVIQEAVHGPGSRAFRAGGMAYGLYLLGHFDLERAVRQRAGTRTASDYNAGRAAAEAIYHSKRGGQ